MAAPGTPSGPQRIRNQNVMRAAKVIIVGSVMFSFISYWRTAAVVLCDLASTAYYIGGIVEQAIGPAAPWFILGVMIFSYAVRSVYIESCTLFVRGGVYRVVREALGPLLAKFAVSALMFDYLLTGPVSGVSAGQYLVGLGIDLLRYISPSMHTSLGLDNKEAANLIKSWGSVLFACGITLYFYRQNILGIHESSEKALKIMIATTVMAAVILIWCGVTLAVRWPGKVNRVPMEPDLTQKWEYATVKARDPITGEVGEMWQRNPGTGQFVREQQGGEDVPKVNSVTKRQEDPLGFLAHWPWLADRLRHPPGWLSLVGLMGIFIAFGHSILAMSGEETLAQVYREVESPKLKNFKKAAFIVFVYSLVLTAGISFLAVLIIPDEVRMKDYKDNLISGLAMYVYGPELLRLVLNAGVVIVGFFILAGAVNTAIIGSNGVLNRVAEDGVMPEWFLKPHPRYGTTYRILTLIVALQLVIILVSQGDTFLLGEAYAFGIVWSFVFQALSMVVLRFKDRRPREFKVPLNIRVGQVEVPIGLSLILVILVISAVMNFLTKEVATVSGIAFTLLFFITFSVSERIYLRRTRGKHHHLEQFNQQTAEEISPQGLGISLPYRKLVAIRSPNNLYMLEKALAETDPDTTEVVVMTAKMLPIGDTPVNGPQIDTYDQELMTAVVQKAETNGKHVKPLIVPTNNPLLAIIRTAKEIQVQELVMGASNKYTADEQMEQIAFYWINLHDGQPAPLTVRILSRDRDVHLDLGGGNRIPKITEKARSVSELRAQGIGVDRVLLAHNGSPENSDLFQAVLTALDTQVALALVPIVPPGNDPYDGPGVITGDQERAKQLGRDMTMMEPKPGQDVAAEIVRLAREGQYDLIIYPLAPEPPAGGTHPLDPIALYLLRNAHCRVFLAGSPAIPQELDRE